MEKLNQRQKEDFVRTNGIKISELDKNDFKIVGEKITESENLSSKPYNYWKTVGTMLIKSPVFVIAVLCIIAIIIAMFVVAPIGTDLVPLIGSASRPTSTPAAPSLEHPFGLGLVGQDFLYLIWAGTRTTLLFSLLITSIEVVVGVLIGLVWGYFRKSDIFFIQITNFLSLIPMLIFILFILSLFQTRGYWILILAVSIQIWIGMAATTRLQVMLVKNTDYNTASTFLGSNSGKIIFRNIMPRILPIIVQNASLAIPSAIGLDATLTYLGFGYIDPNNTKQTSLGAILTSVLDGTQFEVYPHLIIFPLVMITLISVLFYLVGRVFADSLDPKSHR